MPLSLVFVTAGSGERLGLASVYTAAVGLGVLFAYAIPGGLSNSGADYLALALAGVAAGGALGLTIGLRITPVMAWRHVLVGLFGEAHSRRPRSRCSRGRCSPRDSASAKASRGL